MQLLTKFGKLKPCIKYKEDSRHFILTTFPETSISASDATEDGTLNRPSGSFTSRTIQLSFVLHGKRRRFPDMLRYYETNDLTTL